MKPARIVITGGPRTGKTTLSETMENVRHTDDLIGDYDWSEASEHIAEKWLGREGSWVVEGVAAVRALRKWLDANPKGVPCDKVIYLTRPRVPLSDGQARMAKGCETVWKQVAGELRRRGVEIEVR